MRYEAVDVETTMNNVGDERVGGSAASPHHPDNRVVAWCFVREDGYGIGLSPSPLPLTADVLIGHNIKFDLHYINKTQDVKKWIANGGQIWDTMVAEYVLSGMSKTMKVKGELSLDGLCRAAGLPVKDSKITEYFKVGMGADKIPWEELEPYLEADTTNAYALFEAQTKLAAMTGRMQLLLNAMEATLATWVMESNGTWVDKGGVEEYRNELRHDIDVIEYEIHKAAMEVLPAHITLNPSSHQQLSKLFFGGEFKYTEDAVLADEEGNVLKYKSGKKKGEVKTKKVERVYVHPPMVLLTPRHYGAEEVSSGGWSVTEKVLTTLSHHDDTKEMANLLLSLRLKQKELGTYVDGYLSRIWHDGLLHPEYNMALTGTGRLSCSNPNLQNIKSRDDE